MHNNNDLSQKRLTLKNRMMVLDAENRQFTSVLDEKDSLIKD